MYEAARLADHRPTLAGTGVAARAQILPSLPTAAIASAALLSAALVGVALAVSVPIGLGVLIALLYAPLVFLNLALALALWVPLIFFQAVPVLNLGGEAAGLVIAFGWLGILRRPETIEIVSRHRRMLGTLALLVVWLTLSLLWANDVDLARRDLWQWYAIAILFVIVMTTVTTPGAIRALMAMFVVGVSASAAIDLLSNGVVTSTGPEARLEGSAGDPNFLAAMIIVGLVLAVGLAATTRRTELRIAYVPVVALLSVAFASPGTSASVFSKKSVAVWNSSVAM